MHENRMNIHKYMKKIVRNEGDNGKSKEKRQNIERKTRGQGLIVLQNIQNSDGKNSRIGLRNLEKSGEMILGKQWQPCLSYLTTNV